jgi:uncharacterized protein (TIGR03435 family)
MKYASTAALSLFIAASIPGLAQNNVPSFEVASIKLNPVPARTPIHFGPDSVHLTSVDLRIVLMLAYGVRDFQIVGPDWLRDSTGANRFNIEAKASHVVPEDQLHLMLRSLLSDRFHLVLHHEQREMAVIALRADSSGVKLKPSIGGVPPDTQWEGFGGVSYTGAGFVNAPMDAVAAAVHHCTGNTLPPVVDQTGLTGRYDFALRGLPPPPPDSFTPTDDEKLVACNTIVQQDLGLYLANRKAPIDILVVDHADKTPAAN